MPSFSATSCSRLATASPELQRLFNEVIKHFDCTVVYGHRSVAEQQELYAQGRTKPGSIVTKCDGVTNKSMHNYQPSRAVDVVPFPIDWKDTARMTYFAGFVLGTAKQLGIPVRWGGDWDQDTEVGDETFRDFPHFEI